MNQKQWEIFFPHEKRSWDEFQAKYDLDGLQVPLEPRNKGKANDFLGFLLALAAVIVFCLVIVLSVGIFTDDLNHLMGKL